MRECWETESGWPPRLALLAGGLATRLRPITDGVPKSLVPVAGEPFLAHQLRRLCAEGLREVVICAGHLGGQIEEFAGDGNRFGLSIEYSRDGERALGTGGALKKALPLLGQRFLVMYGDSWLMDPMEPVWRAFRASEKPALMTVYRNENRWAASNVELRAGAIVVYGKNRLSPGMQHIDYGLEALDAEAIAERDEAAFDLGEVWADLAARGLLAGFEAASRFYEIGSLTGLRETERAIAVSLDSQDRFGPLPKLIPMEVRQ